MKTTIGELRRAMLGMAIVVLIPGAAIAASRGDAASALVAGKKPGPPVTSARLRRACYALWNSTQLAARYPKTIAVCNLTIAENPSQSFGDPLRSELDSLDAIGRAVTDAEWERIPGTVLPNESDLIKGRGPQLNASITESGVIWGVAQMIADKVKTQADIYVLKRFIARACDAAGQIVPNTCARFNGASSALELIRNPVLLQAAARKDAFAAPLGLLRLEYRANERSVRLHADDAIAGEMIFAAILAGAAGAPIDSALSAMVATDMASLNLVRLSADSTPVSTNLYLVGLAVVSMGQPVSTLVHDFKNLEYAELYTHKSMAMNLFLGRPWKAPLVHALSDATEIETCVTASSAYCAWDKLARLQTVLEAGFSTMAIRADAVRSASTAAAREAAVGEYVVGAIGLVDSLSIVGRSTKLPRRIVSIGNGIKALADSLAAKHNVGALEALLALPDSLAIDVRVPAFPLRVITLVASVADATKASDADSILTAFTKGSRTFLDKRDVANGPFIELNAYAGGAFGWESVLQAPGTNQSRSTVGAVYAPLGIEAGLPVSCKYLPFLGSASLFLQAFDLGALASWRLQSSTDINQAPQVSAAQVFAPGVHAVFGFSGIPLSAGFGVAASPNIRQVTDNGVTTAKSTFRFGVFLAMDIPLYP